MNLAILGIAGGTGSGKSFAVKRLINEYPYDDTVLINMDSYYKDLSYINYEKRIKKNFDHPDSLEIDLLEHHLRQISKGARVNIPKYDFVDHVRVGYVDSGSKPKIIIVEGIFALYFSQLRKLYTAKIFIDTPEKVRFERRVNRDTIKRGRTLKSIKQQYDYTVLPMHKKYIEPSKKFSDCVIDGQDDIKSIVKKIKSLIHI